MKKKLIIGGVAIAATGGLGYLGYRWWQSWKTRIKSTGPAAPGFFPPNPNVFPASLPASRPSSLPIPGARPPAQKPAPGSVFPLKKGSRGPQVILLQKFLNHQYGAKLKVDGIWGNDTEKALKAAGQPNVINESNFLAAEFALKSIGLAGGYTFNRII
jgi:hypothetical protein